MQLFIIVLLVLGCMLITYAIYLQSTKCNVCQTTHGYHKLNCSKNKMYSYHIVSWNLPIKAMLMTDKGKEILRKKILAIKQGGDEVFNTNIPQELFN